MLFLQPGIACFGLPQRSGADMSDNWDDFINELSNDPIVSKPSAKPETRYPCPQCAGTGKWTARRVNRHGNDDCLACRGRGYFLSSPEKRAKNRAASNARKASSADAARNANLALDDGALVKWVLDNSNWNSFAASLLQAHGAGKVWSDKQTTALRSMIAKVAENRAKRECENKQRSVSVDLTAIESMFAHATENGYKKPAYRAEGLVISKASSTSHNAGSLYVKSDSTGEYLGKVTNGVFLPMRTDEAESAKPLLAAIASDPKSAAIRWGQRTGRCSCCGRELTNHSSIDAGIGPICAEKWGLM